MKQSWRPSIAMISFTFAALTFGSWGVAAPPDGKGGNKPPTDPPVLRGDRALGIATKAAEDGNFDAAMNKTLSTGAEVVELPLFWDDIEQAPGVYNPNPNWLAIANAYYPTQNVKVAMIIAVIDTNRKRLPTDLMDRNVPFDSPEMIDRFNGLLGWIFQQVPDLDLHCLSIGNEIGSYLGDTQQPWDQFKTFYDQAVSTVRVLRPRLAVGTKIQYRDILGSRKVFVEAVNEHSDVTMVTYYPLGSDFRMEKLNAVESDFPEIVDACPPDKPVYFMEVGYPSGGAAGSSEKKQSDFVRFFFRAWDGRADRVPLAMWIRLNDISDLEAAWGAGYYGIGQPAFETFLRTLGLRTYEGSGVDKRAFNTLKVETAARGWIVQ